MGGKTVNDLLGLSGFSRWPHKGRLTQPDAWDRYFIGSLAPDAPVINRDSQIVAFGSCFAQNISMYLREMGYTVNAHDWKHNDNDLIRMNELMVHTPALLAQFEWAFNGVPLPEIIINDSKYDVALQRSNLDDTRELIIKSDVYIVTFGLTEAWYDKKQQEYLWKLVPKRDLDADRFENRRISFAENLENINRIYDIIRSKNPDAPVIFTLSPIPLIGTYRDMPVVPASCASKSTLRACLDEFFESHQDGKCFYFPSYEIVNYSGLNAWLDDNRHLDQEVIKKIMVSFAKNFCDDSASQVSAAG